jgi:hypothetical protein
MTEQKIIDGNKLIAEFYGEKYRPVKAGFERSSSFVSIDKLFDTEKECLSYCDIINEGKEPDYCYFPKPNNFKLEWSYDSDWHKLMSAWLKVSQRLREINSTSCWFYHDKMKEALCNVDIDEAYKILVAAIKLINE